MCRLVFLHCSLGVQVAQKNYAWTLLTWTAAWIMVQKLTPTKKSIEGKLLACVLLCSFADFKYLLKKINTNKQARLKCKDQKQSTKLCINKLLSYNEFTDEEDLFDVKVILRVWVMFKQEETQVWVITVLHLPLEHQNIAQYDGGQQWQHWQWQTTNPVLLSYSGLTST